MSLSLSPAPTLSGPYYFFHQNLQEQYHGVVFGRREIGFHIFCQQKGKLIGAFEVSIRIENLQLFI
jgi:hypothetical protein